MAGVARIFLMNLVLRAYAILEEMVASCGLGEAWGFPPSPPIVGEQGFLLVDLRLLIAHRLISVVPCLSACAK